MRLVASDPKAATVKAVFVDGKRVLDPVELDTEEGWVVARVPVVSESMALDQNVSKEVREAREVDQGFSWKETKLTGKVLVIFNGEVNG